MLSIISYIVPHIIQRWGQWAHTHRHANICSQQSCMSQCQQCLLSCNVLYISFQLCYCETKNKKYRPYADKQTLAAEYITTNHHSIFTKIFLGWVNSRCWAGSGSLLKFRGLGSNFCGPPFPSDPMNRLYTIAVLHFVYRTTKCMQFYLQKGWAALDSSKMNTVHSISQNTSL